MEVKESAEYDNYLDKTQRLEDEYSSSLMKFIDIEDALQDQTKAKKRTEIYTR